MARGAAGAGPAGQGATDGTRSHGWERAGGAARCSTAAGAAVQQQELKVSSSRKSRTIAALISKFLGR